eukprot:9474994-Lingulodinium_polyedra.AAC.2
MPGNNEEARRRAHGVLSHRLIDRTGWVGCWRGAGVLCDVLRVQMRQLRSTVLQGHAGVVCDRQAAQQVGQFDRPDGAGPW